jgi:hypothetical protein
MHDRRAVVADGQLEVGQQRALGRLGRALHDDDASTPMNRLIIDSSVRSLRAGCPGRR